MKVHTVNSNSRTSNCQCSLLSNKNPVIWIFCISGLLAVPFNPDKWSSIVYLPLFPNSTQLWDLRFSQQCWLRFQSSYCTWWISTKAPFRGAICLLLRGYPNRSIGVPWNAGSKFVKNVGTYIPIHTVSYSWDWVLPCNYFNNRYKRVRSKTVLSCDMEEGFRFERLGKTM